jgi:hypothetical protein
MVKHKYPFDTGVEARRGFEHTVMVTVQGVSGQLAMVTATAAQMAQIIQFSAQYSRVGCNQPVFPGHPLNSYRSGCDGKTGGKIGVAMARWLC